jgi:hypothetical protein
MAGEFVCVASFILFTFISTGSGYVAITGRITGVVENISDAAIPGATVTSRGRTLMASRSTVMAADGSYTLQFVPIGT